MNYRAYKNLATRRDPEGIIPQILSFSAIQDDEAVKYLAGAMEPVDQKYTDATIREGDRVWNHVINGLVEKSRKADKAYQGSVTKNTHIRAHSDIDLLVVETRFHTLEPPQKPANPYKGDTLRDLIEIREISALKLRKEFPKAEVDESKAKAINISGGSLLRTVDVVVANWYHTVRFSETNETLWRGIQVLDVQKQTREADQPFLHGAWLDHKDNEAQGNCKRLIRLIKSLKYDSEDRVTMSSFDIESLVFRMPSQQMQRPRGEEIQLAQACQNWLISVETNQTLRENLEVPDGKRKIFAEGKATLGQLTALRKEFGVLLSEIEQGLTRSARKLADARIKWPGIH